MKFSFTPARLAALGLLMSCGLAHAQSGALTDVVVTATRFAAPVAALSSSLDVISRDDIERMQAASLAEVLQGLPGFEFARNGGPGTTTSFFLRGHNSANVVVMVDGVRTATDGIGSLLAVDMPLAQIERIEVMRGDASALYGSAANGGVVHIVTRNFEGQHAEVGLGSRGRQSLQAGLSRRAGSTGITLRVGQEQSIRMSAMNPGQKPSANPDNDRSVVDNFALDVSQQIHPGHQVKLTLSRLTAKVDYDDDAFGFGNPSDVHRLDRTTDAAQIVLSSKWTRNWSSELALSQNRQKLEDRMNGALRTADYDFGLARSDQTALRWVNHLALAERTTWMFGADLLNEEFSTDARLSGYRFKKEDAGVFAGLSQELGQWNFQLNLRQDRLATENLLSRTTENGKVDSARLGISYRVSPAWSVVGNASTGFRAPSVGERAYASGPLRDETFRSQEAGLVYRQSVDQFKLTYFQSDMKDMIAYDRNSNLTNLPAQNEGVEASFKTGLGSATFAGSLTLQDPRNQETGKQLARRARQLGSLSVAQAWRGYQMSARMNYQGQRRDSDFSDQKLSAYATVDLGVSRVLNPRTTVRMALENVTDRAYQTAYGYYAPRRNVFLTVAYQDR